MSIPHFNTLDSAPLESLPVPLAPNTTLTPATPEPPGGTPNNDGRNQTTVYTQPSPTPETMTFYTDSMAKVPYHIELEEALTLNNISPTPPTFEDTNEQKCVTDMYNFLTIIARFAADQKSMSDSTLKGIAAIDTCISRTMDGVADLHNTNAQATADVISSVVALDERISKEVHATQGLRAEVAFLRGDLEITNKKLNHVINSLLEIKDMLHEGPRPTGPALPDEPVPSLSITKTLKSKGKGRSVAPLAPGPPAPEQDNLLPEESDGREFSSDMGPAEPHTLKNSNIIFGGRYKATLLSHERSGGPHPGTLEEFTTKCEAEWQEDTQKEDEQMDDTASVGGGDPIPEVPPPLMQISAIQANHFGIIPYETALRHEGKVMSTTSWRSISGTADLQTPAGPTLDAKSYIRSNQAAAIQAQQESTWSTVLRKGGQRNAKGNLNIAPKPSPPKNGAPAPPRYPALPKTSDRPPVVDDSQSWIIRFHGHPPPYAERMTDKEMFNRVNCIPKDRWRFDVLTARWTRNGEGHAITLRFSSDSTDAAVQAHQIAILERLNHGVPSATLTKNFMWSRVVIASVPCLDDIDEDGTEIHTPIETVVEQLQRMPLFQRLNVTLAPRWELNLEGKRFANITFAFEDPFGDLARNFIMHPMFLNGSRCPLRILQDKIAVRQCTRCWRIGASHLACSIRCRFCGKGHHSDDHQKECLDCAREDRVAAGKECTHIACITCRSPNRPPAPHPADSEGCPARNHFIHTQRKRSCEMANYQRDHVRRSTGRV